jgi:hypothetical protein
MAAYPKSKKGPLPVSMKGPSGESLTASPTLRLSFFSNSKCGLKNTFFPWQKK